MIKYRLESTFHCYKFPADPYNLTFWFCSTSVTGIWAFSMAIAIPDPIVPPPITAPVLKGFGLTVL